jgi:hypothetical protein
VTAKRSRPAPSSGVRDIRDYNATASDIGPAVNLALVAAAADFGNTVYVPKRIVPSGNPFWAWTTLGQIFGARSKRMVLQGDEGGTYVLVGGQTTFSVGVFGEVHVNKMVFIGANSNTTDCPAVIEIGETRKAEISNCDFAGIRTNASQSGTNMSLCDTFDIHHNFYIGCDYVGTAGQGGVVMVHGHTQGGSLRNLRFTGVDGYQGLPVFMKQGSAGNVWIYIGGQDDPALGQALAPTVVENCYFEAGAPRACIEINGTKGGAQAAMRCGEVVVQFSGFDCAGICVRADKLETLTMQHCAIGNNASGSVAIMVGNCKRAIFRNVRISGPGTVGSPSLYKVQWTAAVVRAEFHDCLRLNDDGTVNPYVGLVVDESLFTPGATLIYTGAVYTDAGGTARPAPGAANKYWVIRNATQNMREEYSDGTHWYKSDGSLIV